MPTILIEQCPQDHECPAVLLCPLDALHQQGFDAPIVDVERCNDCNECVDFCPMRAIVVTAGIDAKAEAIVQDAGADAGISAGVLRQYRYFSSLSNAALEAIATRARRVRLAQGTVIIRQGEAAQAFYLLLQGKVDVTKRTDDGNMVVLATADAGSMLGERALITSTPRSSSVLAVTDVELAILSRDDFNEIVHFDAIFSEVVNKQALRYSEYDRIKTLAPFALLPPEKAVALSDRLVEKSYSAGENLICQGERGDTYFIVKSGTLSVLREDARGEQHEVDTMTAGAGFGEEALISGAPRNATIRALDDAVVWHLGKADFDEILKASYLENVFETDLEEKPEGRRIFLDVRLAPEFEDEHIEGAINMPLNELRSGFGTLDRKAEYIAYCGAETRSETAAFFLRMLGFDAKSLRGGLSGWMGAIESGSGDVRLGLHSPARAACSAYLGDACPLSLDG